LVGVEDGGGVEEAVTQTAVAFVWGNHHSTS
jgi:hypothetical protein